METIVAQSVGRKTIARIFAALGKKSMDGQECQEENIDAALKII